MHGDFLLILFSVYTVGIIAQKCLKKYFSRSAHSAYPFLVIVLAAGVLIHRISHFKRFEEIYLGIREIIFLTLLVIGGFYVLFSVIIPRLQEKYGSAGDFSPEYKAYRQEESEKKRFLDAVLHGDMEVVKHMLGSSPERIYQKGPGMEHLADYAMKRGRQVMAEFLRGFGKALESRKEMLKKAIIEGNTSKAEEIINRDRYLLKVPIGASGLTALHLAVERGNNALAVFFIEQGADPDAEDREGARPLHYAAATGHLEAAALLIEKGANVAACDNGGAQPLHEAAMFGHVAVARLLIDHGAHPDSADEVLRWTPLYYAEYYDRREMVKFLKDRGARK